MHWLSVIIGLVIAWAILFFIQPKFRKVSYYEPEEPVGMDEPVVGVAMSELDSMMMAVGLMSESTMAPEPAPSPASAPGPAPTMESVADMASSPAPNMDNDFSVVMSPPPMIVPAFSVADMATSQSTEDLVDQDTEAIPQPF